MTPSDILIQAIDSYEAEFGCRPLSVQLTERDYELLVAELGNISYLAGIKVYCDPDRNKSVLSDQIPNDN